jgi:hypothetical protein
MAECKFEISPDQSVSVHEAFQLFDQAVRMLDLDIEGLIN